MPLSPKVARLRAPGLTTSPIRRGGSASCSWTSARLGVRESHKRTVTYLWGSRTQSTDRLWEGSSFCSTRRIVPPRPSAADARSGCQDRLLFCSRRRFGLDSREHGGTLESVGPRLVAQAAYAPLAARRLIRSALPSDSWRGSSVSQIAVMLHGGTGPVALADWARNLAIVEVRAMGP
jgi:hypothetical protein